MISFLLLCFSVLFPNSHVYSSSFKSLLTLSRVISALGQPQTLAGNHIGYRDSKLTRLLQPSLSGNAKLAFICCITLSGLFLDETRSTLQFAQRIKNVKTAPKVNVKVGDKAEIIKRMQEELEEMKGTLSQSVNKLQELEDENRSLKSTIRFLSSDRDRVLEQVQMYEKQIVRCYQSAKRHSVSCPSAPPRLQLRL